MLRYNSDLSQYTHATQKGTHRSANPSIIIFSHSTPYLQSTFTAPRYTFFSETILELYKKPRHSICCIGNATTKRNFFKTVLFLCVACSKDIKSTLNRDVLPVCTSVRPFACFKSKTTHKIPKKWYRLSRILTNEKI